MPLAPYLIAIDDTDNLESRGTGFRARTLAAELMAAGLARVTGITRHQLLVDDRIPYTSHNSSLCLGGEIDTGDIGAVIAFCREFLLRESAPGSDAGLCVAPESAVGEPAIAFGKSAKTTVISRSDALLLGERLGLNLEGLTGDGGGVIGALAAVGLRKWGEDGRFVWMPGLRELSGVLTEGELRARTPLDEVRSLSGRAVGASDRINVEPWPRPVMIGGRSVMLVTEPGTDEEGFEHGFEWKLAPREIVRRY